MTGAAEPARPPGPGAFDRLAMLLALAAFLLVVPAGMMGLLEPTESRHAEIARGMRAGGDWITPRLDGFADFREPPLAHWAAAAGMTLLGENAWGARLPVALAALGLTLFTWIAARRRFEGSISAPILAAWLLLGMAQFQIGARALSSAPFLAAAVAGWWALAPSPWAPALLGLGWLAGGPAVLLPTLLPVLLAAAWKRERAPLALLGPAWGWLAFALVMLPWHVAAAGRTRGLLGYWAGEGLWARPFAPPGEGTGPPWYAVVALIAGALPWTPALAVGAMHAWRERSRWQSRLLLLWLIAPLAVLSASGSRHAADLLPCAPAAAMLAALGFERGGRAVRQATGLLLLLLAAAGWLAARHWLGRVVGVDPPEAFRVPIGVWLALAALALAAFRIVDGPPARAAFLTAVAFTAALVGMARFDRALGSPRGVVEVLREIRGPREPVVAIGRLEAGLPFYLGEPVRLLAAPHHARFDDAATRARVVVTRDSLGAMADAHGRVWLFGPADSTAGLARALGLRWTRVATWNGRAIGFVAR